MSWTARAGWLQEPIRISRPGQDMANLEIVRNFVEQGGKAQLVAATREFTVGKGKKAIVMLGTYSPVRI